MPRFNAMLVLSMLLCGSTIACGQPRIGYRFGLTGGVNVGLIKVDGLSYSSPLWRYNAGFSLEQRVAPALSMVYQVIYSRQGNTVKEIDNTAASGPVQFRQVFVLDYVALPVLIRFQPKNELAFVEIGGQVGTLIHTRFYHSNTPAQVEPIYHTHSLDTGLTGGVGRRFGRHLVVDGRYYYGLQSVRDDFTRLDPQTGVSTVVHLVKWYNRVFSLDLSYYF